MMDPFADLVPASDPAFTGYIPGTPKAKEPKAPVFVPQGATQMFDPNTNTYVPVPKAPGGDEKDALKEAIAGLGVDELLGSIKRARQKIKTGWATGTWGAIAELKPGGGTPRDDFLGQLKSIQGGIINEKLTALKEASKTGASGLGALSEKEGERLASSVAALTENMSDPAYEDSFKEIARHAYVLQAVRDGKDPRDPATQKEIEGQVNSFLSTDASPASGGGGNESSDKLTSLTPEQAKKEQAFIASKPSGEQYASFLSALLNRPINAPVAAERLKAFNSGAAYDGGAIDDKAYRDKVAARKAELDAEGKGRGTALGVGIADGITIGSADEINAFGNALRGSLSGRGSFSDLYGINVDANRSLQEDLQNEHGGYYLGGQLIGGAALAPAGGFSGGGQTLGALARAGAKTGAGYGALYGFNSGSGAEGRVTGAATGAITGAVGGALAPYAVAGVGKVVNPLIPKRFRPSQGMAPELADASEAEGVDLIRPMVDPNAISDYGALESNVYSQPIIRGATARVRGQIEDRVEALGRGGNALDELSLGQGVQSAARRDHATLKAARTRLYDRARVAAEAEGNPDITPAKALAATDAEIAQLERLPTQNAGEIEFLKGLKADLSQPGLKLQDIRDLRTGLRSRITDNLLRTKAEARASKILDVARDDIEATVGEKTASAFRRADSFESQRRSYVRDVIEKFIGTENRPVEPGKAFQRLKAMASPRGDGRRLAAFYRRLDLEEQNDVAASFAEYIGKNASDAPFSTAEFLRQTKGLSPSAMRTIFGPGGERSIQNLRLLSRKLEEAGKDINRSRSATVLERQGVRMAARNFISSIAGITGGGALATGHTGTGVAAIGVAAAAMGSSAVRRVLSARAMVNPRVSRWLAESADASTPAQAKEATRKLGVIISREPALANELRPIFDMLENRLERPLSASEQRRGADDDRQ